jgi:predicted Fe-S protein YdhL (DUF1289 family)
MDEASGWCVGCLRTLDEIAAWSTLDDEGRRAVWRALPPRRTMRARMLRPGVSQPPAGDAPRDARPDAVRAAAPGAAATGESPGGDGDPGPGPCNEGAR